LLLLLIMYDQLRTLELNDRTSSYSTSITDLLNRTLGNGAFSNEALLNCIGDSGSICLYATVNETVAGFARFQVLASLDGYEPFGLDLEKRFSDQKIGSLSLITVNESFRGKGIATEITQKGLEWLKKQGCDSVLGVCWVSGVAQNSKPLFEHFGFQNIGECSDYYRNFSIEHPYDCPGCHKFPCECSALLYALTIG